jgi:hypothetical protein
MRLTRLVVGAVLLAATPAPAAERDAVDVPADGPPRGRVELRAGLGVRDDLLTSGAERVTAKGGTVSEVAAGGAWFAGDGPWGLAGRLEVERFGVHRTDAPGSSSTPVTGLELGAGGAGRWSSGALDLEGQLGWSFLQVPVVGVSDTMTLHSTPVTAHGPLVAALVGYRVSPWLALEANGKVIPVTFGGDRQGQSVPLHRFSAGAAALIGRYQLGGVQMNGLLSYDLGSTGADGSGVSVSQTRHQIGLGLRATMLGPPAPVVVAAPPPPPVEKPAPRGSVIGTVHAAPFDAGEPLGPPLPGVTLTIAGHAPVVSDARGEFRIDGLPPGLLRLRAQKGGMVATEEVVSVEANAEARLALTMRPTIGPAPAALIAFVRDDTGQPVAAHVKVMERSLSADADERGQVRFDVPPGRYTVVIEAPGFAPQRKVVRTVPGEQSIYDIDLQREH